MMMSNQQNQNKVSYTGLGIIFGSAIGSAISMIITGTVLWGLVGTAVGLILGAAVESYKSRCNRGKLKW
jgi:uncharacterized membrane protein YfcA